MPVKFDKLVVISRVVYAKRDGFSLAIGRTDKLPELYGSSKTGMRIIRSMNEHMPMELEDFQRLLSKGATEKRDKDFIKKFFPVDK